MPRNCGGPRKAINEDVKAAFALYKDTIRSTLLDADPCLAKRVAPAGLSRRLVPVETVGKIIEIIESGRVCTARALASEFHLSVSHLQHLFKQHTGLSLGRILTEHRMQIAAQLLQNSSLRVKQIAGAVGYEHASSFVRAFERRFHEAPQMYREHWAGSDFAENANAIAGKANEKDVLANL